MIKKGEQIKGREKKWTKNKTFEWGNGGPTPSDISLKFPSFFWNPSPISAQSFIQISLMQKLLKLFLSKCTHSLKLRTMILKRINFSRKPFHSKKVYKLWHIAMTYFSVLSMFKRDKDDNLVGQLTA